MKHYYILAAFFICGTSAWAQDLEIQNLSSNWGYNFDPETGVISNVFFNPAEGDGTDIDDSFVVSWGVQSDPNDPGTYTELDRQTITQGLPAFNSITVDNWSSQNMNDFGLPAGDYLVVAWVDTDDDISETDESDNALFLASSADDAFSFEPGGGTNIAEPTRGGINNVYPNPAQNQLRVKMSHDGPAQWNISDQSGRIVQQGQSAATETLTLDLRNLQSGLYVLTILEDHALHSTRFVKE